MVRRLVVVEGELRLLEAPSLRRRHGRIPATLRQSLKACSGAVLRYSEDPEEIIDEGKDREERKEYRYE